MALATPYAPAVRHAMAGNTKCDYINIISAICLFIVFRNSKCRGPGWDISDIESNRIIGKNQALKALQLYKASSQGIAVEGKVDYVQRYWDITKAVVRDKNSGENLELCLPAMVSRKWKKKININFIWLIMISLFFVFVDLGVCVW